jgi:hypothetical protein
MARIVEYRFGKVSCQSIGGLSEGMIKSVEHIQAAFEALRRYRSHDRTKWWDHYFYCSNEETADKLIKYLEENHSESLRFTGERPGHAAHGKVFFIKMAELELTAKEEEKVDKGLAGIIGSIPSNAKKYQ